MKGKERFFYSALHPVTIAVYLLGQIVLGMFIMHPIFVGISLFFSILLCFAVCGKDFLKELKIYIPFYVIVAVSNPLFSHSGITPLFFLNGKPITYEAIIYGIVSSGMFLSVLLWCRVWSAVMTEEKLVYLIGKKLPKLGLVLSVSFRMIPRFRQKWREIKEVQTTFSGDEKGFVDQIKAALSLFSALVTHAMESSIETGMSMAARGFGEKGRTSLILYKFRKRDAAFLTVNLCLLAAIVVGIAYGAVRFDYYPSLSPVVSGRMATGVFCLFAAQSALLLLQEIKEEVVWRFSRSKI